MIRNHYEEVRFRSHNRTLMAADLRLCGTYFLATSELSLFVLASSKVKRRMFDPLASVQEDSFRKRGQRFRKRVLKARFEKLKLVLYGNVSKREQQLLTLYNYRVGGYDLPY